jgi:nitroreductase
MLPITEAIRSRRTIFHFKPGPVPRDVLEEVLAAGIWAPNHHLTEPWRFTAIGEETKLTLAERYREIQIEKVSGSVDVDEKALARVGEKGFEKFMSKPTVVAVSCIQEGDEQRQREDYAATCCAMYCIQLAAWEKGIGMQWSTGAITQEQGTYDLLGVDSDREYIIGFCYIGYPAQVPTPKRKPLSEVLRWTP